MLGMTRLPTIHRCFPGGRHKALTMSYDDGQLADRRLVEIFNRTGIKGTFHLNYGLIGEPKRIPATEIRDQYAGHEVGAHTLTHPTIARCPIDQVALQVMEDRRGLESLVGYPVRGLSYPNGSHNPAIRALLPGLGIDYARTVGSSRRFDLPEDLYRWDPTCMHKHDLMALGGQLVGFSKRQYLYLMYVWGHSYNFDDDGNWDLIEGFCRLVGGRDDLWYATSIQIVDWMRAHENLRFSADGRIVDNPNASAVWLDVDGVMVEVPGGKRGSLG
jgi:peptidoglycan/xylan/chitin deacetylase (PgdA/CDA1 family)